MATLFLVATFFMPYTISIFACYHIYHLRATGMCFIYPSLDTVTYILPHISVLYHGGASGFSLAMVMCEGLQHVAMRWNVANKEQQDSHKQEGKVICTGSPALGAVPTWFILPREVFSPALFYQDSSTLLHLVNS